MKTLISTIAPGSKTFDCIIPGTCRKSTSWLSYSLAVAIILVAITPVSALAQTDFVSATGPAVGTALEDRVEVSWGTETQAAVTSSFHVKRDGELVYVAASTQFIYEDFTAVPDSSYDYCVDLVEGNGTTTTIACDTGGRVISRPTGFEASDGMFETHVLTQWSDRSEIEGGYNVYREAGNALAFDGTNDYLSAGMADLGPSFTFEFWARRASTGSLDFVINLELDPNGDPQDPDVEAGFTADNRFEFSFGTDALTTADTYVDLDWHHWAVAFDAQSGRRIVYRDGQLVATDVTTTAPFPSYELEIGRQSAQGSPRSRGWFDGEIDEVRHWSVALTGEQVQSRMNALLTGSEPGLVGYWPMDVHFGLIAPDVVGDHDGTLINMDPTDWVTSGVSRLRIELEANVTSYADRTSVIGFQTYTYNVAAFEDVDGDGTFTPGTDFQSEERTDDGWRAFLTPPGNVSATDGQFLDRVRVTWLDLSDAETAYNVYRDAVLVATLPADSRLYDDFAASTIHTYCVTAAGGGTESVQICDDGMAGDLPTPKNVIASNGDFDDRVLVSWADSSDTEDGFEMYRDSVLIATLGSDAEEFNDLSAEQHVEYDYCVRAFSKADPLNPSYSDLVCASAPGLRAIILGPTGLTATYEDFEDHVDLAWQNPSTTAMVFLVYRDSLIQVLDFNTTSTSDTGIPSDADVDYCVTAATVVSSASLSSAQGRVAQLLENFRLVDAVAETTGEETTTIAAKMDAIYDELGISLSASGPADTSGFVESDPICATGRRSLLAPTTVDATDNEFENHVQVNWDDNSAVEAGYLIFRDATLLDSLSANRTTFGDYEGVPGVQYSYTVQAFDDFDDSQTDSDNGVRTLNPPSNLQATDGESETFVILSWDDKSAAEDGFRIRRRMSNVGPYVVVGTTGPNEPGFMDMIPDSLLGEVYDYQVVAFDAFGESLPAFDRGSTFVTEPANVNASDNYAMTVAVIWVDQSSVEDNYVLTRRPVLSGAVDTTVTLAANATMYTDSDASPNVQYEYCVSAAVSSMSGQLKSTATCDIGGLLSSGGGPVTPGTTPTKIFSFSPFGALLRFGTDIAEDNMNALIGAPESSTDLIFNQGIGVVDAQTFSATNVWTSQQIFGPDPGAFGIGGDVAQEFGHAVDVDGVYAVVGDPMSNTNNRGIFSLWKKETGSWTRKKYTIETVAGGSKDNTGYDVAVLDSFAIIGNNQLDDGTLPDGHGSAIICNIDAAIRNNTSCRRSEGVPRLDSLLSAAQMLENAAFGAAVDITRVADSLYAIVGATGNDQAYIFKCNVKASDCEFAARWELIESLVSPAGPGKNFGASVAINEKLAVVGAPGAERILVYERTEGAWEQRVVFTPDENALEFGSSVAIDDTVIVVGAPGESIAGIENAGAIYTMGWDAGTTSLTDYVRYDARPAGDVLENARFGESVEVGSGFFMAGAPGDTGIPTFVRSGAVYSIPFGFEPPDDPIIPPGVSLATPGGIRASDGTAPDRIQIRWDDESDDEDGHIVFRSDEQGELERLAEVSANIEFFDDFEAAPGEAYTYCLAAFFGEIETELQCDIGWRPPNGTIAGIIAAPAGGGTEGAQVCLVPNPNKALLLDGVGGFAEVAVGEELALFDNFTVEAWIRPHAVDGSRYIISKDSSFALKINAGNLEFEYTQGTTTSSLTGPALTAGTWQHVAVTVGERVPFEIKLLLNGVATDSTDAGGFINTSGDSLALGQKRDGTGFFKGELDEVKIWKVARPDSLILNDQFMALEGDEEGLVAYWPLDQGLRRVVPDVTESASHGRLIDGIYLADNGAPLDICDITTTDGNYSISGIHYGESTEFNVVPTKPTRVFEPSFQKITLTVESPVENQVPFVDRTAYTVAGVVRYVDVVGTDSLICPVPEVNIHASKDDVALDDNVRTTTKADGGYAVALDPSIDAGDTWFVIPRFIDPDNDEVVHSFSPAFAELVVQQNLPNQNFDDNLRFTLSGNFSGGDPATCGKDIGEAEIRIRTQDGCYDRTIMVDSDVNNGAFSLSLPPLEYLVEVVSVTGAPAEREEEIQAFFEALGTVEVDMTVGDVERNLIYRAPIVLSIDGLDAPSCPGDQIVQEDEDGNVIRTLQEVATIGEFEFVPLTISVREDYGNGEFCNVDEGTVTIFDAIADRVDADSTLELSNGTVEYVTVGTTPNIFSGARIGGVDRSFQKPITVLAQVEGRPSITETQWALVEGSRERGATFISATTEEFPLLMVHDPPGSNSSAFIEKGATFCNRITNTRLLGGGAGVDIDLRFGFTSSLVTAPLGIGIGIETGGGFAIGGRVLAGQDVTSLQSGKPNREICVATTEAYSTSDDAGFVGEDIHVGVALNLIFAIADVLEFEDAACKVSLSETLAADLDESDPFETTYAFGKSHIALSLIPELENLIKLAGGDPSITGDIKGTETTIRLQSSVDNWERQLVNSDNLKEEALSDPEINRSFSGGADFSFVETVDTTTVTHFESTRIFVDAEGHVGGVLNLFDFEQNLFAIFEVHSEWVNETEDSQTAAHSIGYLLSDGDTGDFFSVDVARNPRYRTYVFGTRSGRSSNPWESNTQKRDNPIILVDPPVAVNVDPGDAARFDLTLINGSESNERRRYVVTVPAETNPGNLGVSLAGARLSGTREFLLDPGKAKTFRLDAVASPGIFSYNRVGAMIYPPDEYPIWAGDPRLPFAVSDTAFFSVFFDSTGGNVMASVMSEGWNWVSFNREGGEVGLVLVDYSANQGDLIKDLHTESRYDTTVGWTGSLTELVPGQAYRFRAQRDGFLRIKGDPVVATDPMMLRPGWNWVGYLPAKRMPVGDALASLNRKIVEGDAIVGQHEFAQYANGIGWVGTLTDMEPGEAYMLYLAGGGKLLYPEAPETIAPREPIIRETTVRGPEWKVVAEKYDAAMTMVGEIRLGDSPLRHSALKVAVVDDEEVRGTGEVLYVEELDQYLAFVLVYGGSDEETDLRVHIYDGETDALYEDIGTVHYAAQSMLGQPASPVSLDLGKAGMAPELLDLPEEFALYPNYPNPFNPVTIISYDLPEAAKVTLTVFDVLGRRVVNLVNEEKAAGRYKTVFDAQSYASGLYLYRLKAGDFKQVGRMILVK